MSTGQLDRVVRQICKLVAPGVTGPLADGELLDSFVRRQDEAAFAALVERHGAMVLSVCRRVLHHAQDAEDACQAAFLVLARKAGSVRKRSAVASWLHGVAFRVAQNLKRSIARRSSQETAVADVAPVEPGPDLSWREVQAVIDEEITRLPDRCRAPLVLCYLEGKTRDEAAQLLGWTEGTLRGRLERGRKLLRSRLTRRGLTLAAVMLALAAAPAGAAPPATLVVTTLKAALSFAAGQAGASISGPVVALSEGALKTMWFQQWKAAAALLVALSLFTVSAGVWSYHALAAPPTAQPGLQPRSAATGESEISSSAAQQAPDPDPVKAPDPPARKLTDDNFERMLSSILPRKDEQQWRELGWHTTLSDAVIEAQKQDKPILLWSMHGHPLAEV